MCVELDRLKAARKTVVHIVQGRKDGAQFVRVILELERQIAAMTDLDEELARIMNEAA